MTKKDYVMLAEVIHALILAKGDKYYIARRIGMRLTEDNPKFNNEKWFKVCGLGD